MTLFEGPIRPTLGSRLAPLFIAVFLTNSFGQVTPEEHAAHHPDEAAAAETSAAADQETGQGAPGPPGKEGGGGMMGGGGKGGMMGGGGKGGKGMMDSMGVPPPKELYPSLMDLPSLPMEKRAEVQAKAHERMQLGTALLSQGLEDLALATPGDDFELMQQATAKMREGLAQFESGVAAHRALAEGRDPRNVAVSWFKREMNLTPSGWAPAGGRGLFGLSWFHFFVMAILGLFATTMIWMYFLKMKRATHLLQRLATASSENGSVAAPPEPAAPSPSRPAPPPAPAPHSEPAEPAEPTEAVAVATATSAPTLGKKWKGTLSVSLITLETPDVKTFRLASHDGGPLPFTFLPGQFLTLTVSPDGKPVKRSYTIASSPTRRDQVELTIKREEHGIVSRYMHDQLEVGDTLEVAAPMGRLTFVGDDAEGIVLIAGGVGVTPMMSVIRYLTDQAWPGKIYLLFSCRTSNHFIFREELEYLQRRHANLNVVATMTRDRGTVWMGGTGRFNKVSIAESAPHIAEMRVHLCGPPPMMDAVETMLQELGVPPDQLKTEVFGAPKNKPKPAASPAPDPPSGQRETASPAQAATVTFSRAGKNAPLASDKTILEAAEDIGVEIDNSCRIGTCGSCTVQLKSGTVSMECEDGLDPDDKAAGVILACQAKSDADVVVEE